MSDVVERAKDSLSNYDYAHTYGCDPGYPAGLLRSLVTEVENLRAELAFARDGIQVRPMTETESYLMTQVLDLRRELAEAKNRHAEQLRLLQMKHEQDVIKAYHR